MVKRVLAHNFGPKKGLGAIIFFLMKAPIL